MNTDTCIFLSNSLFLSAVTLLLTAGTGLLRRRYSPNWIYRIFIMLAALWILPFRPRIQLPAGILPSAAPSAAALVPSGPSGMIPVFPSPLQNTVQETPANTGLSLPAAFFAIWLAGLAAVSLYYIFRQVHFSRFVKRWSLPVTDEHTLKIFEGIKADSGNQDSGSRRYPDLLLCRGISSPMLTGLLKPVILLPTDAYADFQLHHILRHEYAHYRQRDLPAKLLVLAATAVHWFNPVIWLFSRTISLQCEMACDEQVLKGLNMEKRKEYGRTIINVMVRQNQCRPVLSTNFNGGKKDIMTRLCSIMASGRKKSGLLPLCLLLGAVVLSSCTAAQETKISGYGYMVLKDNILHFDEVEIIRPEDTDRMAELELVEQHDMPSGFCIYNENADDVTYELTDDTTYTFTDMELYFVNNEDGTRKYTTNSREEFLRHLGHLNDYPLDEQTIPYFIEVKDGKVISITEEFEFTI